MKKKGLGIFGKIFLYTLFLLILVTATLAVFFRGQVIVILEDTKTWTTTDAASASVEISSAAGENAVELYSNFTKNTVTALAIILLVSTIGAALFARSMANPIKKLAADTTKMSNLQAVSAQTLAGTQAQTITVSVPE